MKNTCEVVTSYSFFHRIKIGFTFTFLSVLFFSPELSYSQNCINTPTGSVTSTPVTGGCDLVVDLCITVSGSPRPKRVEYLIAYDSNGDGSKDATQLFVYLPGGSGAPNGTHCLSTMSPSETFLVPGVSCTTDFDATISGYTSAAGGGGNLCYEFIGNLTESGGFVESSLPVELTNFEGMELSGSNQLKWLTASEKNVEVFIIERLAQGQEVYEEIGRVEAVGNSTVNQSYIFEDIDPLFLGYYRLKILDLDGSFEYSNVIALEQKVKELVIKNIFPNPVQETLNIDFQSSSPEINVSVFDFQGRLAFNQIFKNDLGFKQVELGLENLSGGMYFLKVNDEKNEVQRRILKIE